MRILQNRKQPRLCLGIGNYEKEKEIDFAG